MKKLLHGRGFFMNLSVGPNYLRALKHVFILLLCLPQWLVRNGSETWRGLKNLKIINKDVDMSS